MLPQLAGIDKYEIKECYQIQRQSPISHTWHILLSCHAPSSSLINSHKPCGVIFYGRAHLCVHVHYGKPFFHPFNLSCLPWWFLSWNSEAHTAVQGTVRSLHCWLLVSHMEQAMLEGPPIGVQRLPSLPDYKLRIVFQNGDYKMRAAK